MVTGRFEREEEKETTTMTELIAHARSAGVINPSLNMFKVPPTDISMSSRRYVKISPFNTGINPVTFQVDPQDEFINMTESYFEMEIVIKKNDGTNIFTGSRRHRTS